MSWIWNVMLSFSNEERWGNDDDAEPSDSCEPLDRINSWIEGGKLVDLTKPTYAKNAGYGMDANLYGGGFNHFDIENFITLVEAQPWKDWRNLQLWVKGEEQDSFTLVKLRRPRVVAAAKKPVTGAKARNSQPAAKRKKRRN